MTPEQLKYSILGQAFRGLLTKPNEKACFQNIRMFDIDDELFDIPEQWEWTTFGNICEMYTGNSIAESEKKLKYCGVREGYDYIATKDVSYEQKIEYDNGVKIPYDTDFKIAKQSSILMCIEGGSAGRKLAIVEHDVCFGNKLCMFMPFEVYNLYLFYYLQSAEFKHQFSNNMTGIIGGVSIKKLKDLYIPIPSINEQKEIVNQIEKFLPYVDRYTVAYAELNSFTNQFSEDMKKSILQYAMQGKLVEQRPEEGTGEELYQQIQREKEKLIKAGIIKKEKPLSEITEEEKPFEIPKSWKWVKLNSLVTVITDGDHQPPPQVEVGVPFLVISNISQGNLSFINTRNVSQEYYDSLQEARKPQNGDILFTVTGSYGIVIPIKTDQVFCVQRHIAIIKKPFVSVDYLVKCLLAPYSYKQCKEKATGTAQKTVGLETLRNLILPLPPLTEQERIVAKLEEVLTYCQRIVR